MELGERLKQARLEAGLSQRQLCGTMLTRNMLSLIENGSARPSMDTLKYLAGQLGKPVSWFLEEQTVTSPNREVMERARSADAAGALEALKAYKDPDDTYDRERWLLEALCCLKLAEAALAEQKPLYAQALLEQAARAGENTPYYTPELERKRILLLARVGGDPALLTAALPDLTEELLLRAETALEAGQPQKALGLLEGAAPVPGTEKLRADALFALERYGEAKAAYEQAVELAPQAIYRRLEACCEALEDYKGAYYYACKQREN